MISEATLQKALFRRFQDEICGIANAYIYDNESDYLSISRKNIATEVEIKISRSDFKADFKKPKHSAYKAFLLGSKLYVNNLGESGGMYRAWEKSRNQYRKHDYHFEYSGELYENFGRHTYQKPWTTSIRFSPIILPNRFYYFVPNGLISKEEVPEYAGLMYFFPDENDLVQRAFIVKRAPTIHKNEFTMWKPIATKLYNRLEFKHNPQLKLL